MTDEEICSLNVICIRHTSQGKARILYEQTVKLVDELNLSVAK